MTENLVAARWDKEYGQTNRYEGEPPIAFTQTILGTLGEDGKKQIGLYIGCGNGRNYLPLLNSGLNLYGMDISREAVNQLRARQPDTANRTSVTDFGEYNGAHIFDYIVAIQVFQHGNRNEVDNLLSRSRVALKHLGKLFMRVNSVNTEDYFSYDITEASKTRGRTVRYTDGPKEGLEVHFFDRRELTHLANKHDFNVLQKPKEMTEKRKPPQTGMWAQWETVWQRTD